MAIYNLYDGGNMRFKDCGCYGDDLPVANQPDLRVDGGYGFRHKTHWAMLMNDLWRIYGMTAKDLKVGDKLRIFLQPNHATLKSLFVDFCSPPNGLTFSLKTVRELELTGKTYLNTYDEHGEVVDVLKDGEELAATKVIENLGGNWAERTQYSLVLNNNPHTPKVDAIELEITQLPKNGLPNHTRNTSSLDIVFTRRFEMDGTHIR